jgi:cell wall-associated NlpC family hydrolase
MKKSELYEFAISLFGLPYVWGGNGPLSFDCSGLVQHILKFAQIDPLGDQTALTLYQAFVSSPKERGFGALAFYGSSEERIHHVGFCIDEHIMLNASGGGRNVINIQRAKELGASVKIEPINWRKDLFAVIMPQYNLKGI